MSDRYTSRLRRILQRAHSLAREHGVAQVGSEHLLVALLSQEEGVAVEVLQARLYPIDRFLERARGLLRWGEGSRLSELPFDDAARSVLQAADHEAGHLGHTYVGSEHLLLGFLHGENDRLGVMVPTAEFTLEVVRAAVLDVLRPRREHAAPTHEPSAWALARLLTRLGFGTGDSIAELLAELPEAKRNMWKHLAGDGKHPWSVARDVLLGNGSSVLPGTALVLLGDGEHAALLYDNVIEPILSRRGLVSVRRDSKLPSTATSPESWLGVRSAELLIIDVGCQDPSTLMRVGMALAMGRRPLFLAHAQASLPIELAHTGVIRYELDAVGMNQLRSSLRRRVEVHMHRWRRGGGEESQSA